MYTWQTTHLKKTEKLALNIVTNTVNIRRREKRQKSSEINQIDPDIITPKMLKILKPPRRIIT